MEIFQNKTMSKYLHRGYFYVRLCFTLVIVQIYIAPLCYVAYRTYTPTVVIKWNTLKLRLQPTECTYLCINN